MDINLTAAVTTFVNNINGPAHINGTSVPTQGPHSSLHAILNQIIMNIINNIMPNANVLTNLIRPSWVNADDCHGKSKQNESLTAIENVKHPITKM